jgi:two-component system OmpR family response regulator
MGASSGETTVLVVDDDDALRMLCRVNLELDGYRVLEAHSLAAARQTLDEEEISVVLLDCRLGDGDGRDLLRELRRDTAEPSVALFTGSESLSDQDQRLADGMIPKPFTLDELVTTVGRLARRSPR